MIAEKTTLPDADFRVRVHCGVGSWPEGGWLSRPGEDDGSARGPF